MILSEHGRDERGALQHSRRAFKQQAEHGNSKQSARRVRRAELPCAGKKQRGRNRDTQGA